MFASLQFSDRCRFEIQANWPRPSPDLEQVRRYCAEGDVGGEGGTRLRAEALRDFPAIGDDIFGFGDMILTKLPLLVGLEASAARE